MNDVCPENPEITDTDFRNLEMMDLCETNNVTSKILDHILNLRNTFRNK